MELGRESDKEQWIDDERYRNRARTLKNYEQFNKEITELMKTKTYQAWADLFETHEVMYGPVNNMEDVTKDPQVNAREMIVEVEHPQAGKHKIVGTPMKFSRTPCRIDKAGPELGADTDDVLKTRLGFGDENIRQMRDDRVI